jgi:tubulin--tyrosine ligase
MHVETP